MSDNRQSTTPPPDYPAPELSPTVSFFRHVALLNVPPYWRELLQHLGIALFNWTLEVHGIATEEPNTERITERRLNALASDLESVAEQLGSIGLEPGQSETTRRERSLCELAERIAPPVWDVARELRRESRPGAGSA